jgi:hypothetical protein
MYARKSHPREQNRHAETQSGLTNRVNPLRHLWPPRGATSIDGALETERLNHLRPGSVGMD